MCSSIDNILHSSGRAVEKSGILLQITSKSSYGALTYHVSSLEDAVTHVAVSNLSGILNNGI